MNGRAALHQNEIGAEFQMVATDPAFAGIVRDPALGGALVQGPGRRRSQRAEAHRQDVQPGGRIRLGTLRIADGHAVRCIRDRP